MEPILSVKDITVVLDKQEILKNISFDVFPQDVVSVIGPNGSGKSVLLKTIIGIIKPESGSISFSSDVKIGYLPQRFSVDRYLPMTVMEFLKLKPKVSLKAIKEALGEIGLEEDFLKKTLASLSSGQLQKVLIAWVISDHPI